MLKGFVLGILFTVAAAVLAGYLAIVRGVLPANADARPPQFERWAARRSLFASIRRGAPRIVNPLAATDPTLIAGIRLYHQNCAACHGSASGRPSNIAKGLYQHAPQLARDGVEDDPSGITYWKIAHGIRWTGMPAFDRSLTDTQLWQLVAFLQHMDRLPPAAQKVWRGGADFAAR